MLKNVLWRNPVGWAERMVGTKLRFGTILAIQVFIGAYVLYMRRCCKLDFVLDWVIFLAAILPFYYLYAMKKLLEGFKKLNSNKQ